MNFDVIVTRHTALVHYLNEKGYTNPDTTVLSHVTDTDQIKDKNVVGVLPHSMSCLCKTFSEVPLNIPADKRGKELTLEDMYEMAGELVTYSVQKL